MEGFKIFHPQICHLWIILSWRHLTFNRFKKKPSWSPYLTESRNSWDMSVALNLSRGSFLASQKLESWHRDQPVQTNLAKTVLFSFIFQFPQYTSFPTACSPWKPKIPSFVLSCLRLLLFAKKLYINSKTYLLLWVFTSFLGRPSPHYIKINIK